MTSDLDRLNELADLIVEEFDAYRPQHGFKDVSVVIEDSDPDHPTLIVHIDRENAAGLADQVEEFLEEQGARTERETHSSKDVRVLAIT